MPLPKGQLYIGDPRAEYEKVRGGLAGFFSGEEPSVMDPEARENYRRAELSSLLSDLIPGKASLGVAGGALGMIKNLGGYPQINNYLRWLATNKADRLASGASRNPEGISRVANLIMNRLDRIAPVSRVQKDNVARMVDELGLDTLGFRGYMNTPEEVAKFDIRKHSPAHGFSEHTDLTPDARQARAIVSPDQTIVPVLMRTREAPVVTDYASNNVDALLTAIGHRKAPYPGESSDVLPEEALDLLKERGFPSIVYPNTFEGSGKNAAKLQILELNKGLGADLDNPVVINPSAVPMDQSLYRFAMEAEGKPGTGYRKAQGGLIQMRNK